MLHRPSGILAYLTSWHGILLNTWPNGMAASCRSDLVAWLTLASLGWWNSRGWATASSGKLAEPEVKCPPYMSSPLSSFSSLVICVKVAADRCQDLVVILFNSHLPTSHQCIILLCQTLLWPPCGNFLAGHFNHSVCLHHFSQLYMSYTFSWCMLVPYPFPMLLTSSPNPCSVLF